MPYKSNRDLPRKQVDQYSRHQRDAFRKAFNRAAYSGQGEGSSFRIAHSAAKRAGSSKTKE